MKKMLIVKVKPTLNYSYIVRFLNINRDINSICAGQLNPKWKRDVLLIGTETNLLGYDVHNNADIFYRASPAFFNCNKN
jgi:hypothetical protein